VEDREADAGVVVGRIDQKGTVEGRDVSGSSFH
jgi:hypothetical protein